MKYLLSLNVLIIVALLLVGFTTPMFGQCPPLRGKPLAAVETAVIPLWVDPSKHPPAATPEPSPPPTKEPPPVSLGTDPGREQTESFTADAAPSGKMGITSIAGSTVTGSDCHQPGDTATLCFTAYNASTDDEWLDGIALTLPAGWTVACSSKDVQDSGGNAVAFTCSAAGNNVSYTDNDGGYGEIYDGESWGFCVDVTAPASACGTQLVDWALSGDDWRGPPHDVTGTLSIEECLPLCLTPGALKVEGCNGISQTHTLDLWNNTGGNGTFDLAYDVPSGNGTLSGPASLSVNDGDTVTFTVTLTPDLCIMANDQVRATIEASGSGYSDTSVITKTVSALIEWRPAAPTPQGTRYHAVTYHDGYLYQIGGETGWWVVTDAVKRYDMANDSWSAATAMITGVYGIDAVAIGDYIYIPGGSDDADDTGDGGTFLDALQVYSTTADTWSLATPMPVALAYASAVAYDDKLYVIGGELNDGSYTNTLHIYDPATDIWSQGTSMKETRGYAAAAAIGDRIYVAGGFAGGTTVRNSLEIYDPATDSWSIGPDLPKDWAPFGDGVLNDRYFVVFNGDEMSYDAVGGTRYTCHWDAYYFDTVTQEWVALPELSRCYYGSQGAGDGTNFYLISGRTNEGDWHMATEVEYLQMCPTCEEQGWLEGYVMDSELGDTEPPCTDAVVHIEPGALNVSADPATGYYGPVQVISGTYTVVASASGFFDDGPYTATVTTGVTTTQDFNLRRPVIVVTPTNFISITAAINQPVTYTLTISNDGHRPLDFEIYESTSSTSTFILNVLSEPRPNSGIEVEPELQARIDANGAAGYLIFFRERPDLSPAFHMGWQARGWFVMNALQKTAERSQAGVRAYLDARGADYQAFWIDNVIVVEKSSRNALNGLMSFPEIAALRARRTMHVIEPVDRAGSSNPVPMSIESSISHVGADQVWGMGFRGEGVVVANIDTGVRYTHDALVSQYRGNLGGDSYNHDYNWLGAAGGSNTPVDDHGHGSHTMGTMIGDDGGVNQVGMAPGARWIACDGCEGAACPDAALLTCAQWVAAPYPIGAPGSPDPDKRPHIVNNSWGDCEQSYDNWYQASVDAWHAVGIYPVFSNGNNTNCGYSAPPGCNTVGNPARYGNVTGIGSTGQSDGQYATHSNWGATDNPDTINPRGHPNLKPQVVAPGVDIRSSLNGSDSDYASWGGTSMSVPHVAGLIALMWQAAPCLVGDYAATETIIEQTATPVPYASGCGGEGPGNVPNHATGWGEINAYSAVEAAMSQCDLPWVWQDPISGTVSGPGQIEIDVTFDCTETKDYTGTLLVLHNDPCENVVDVPIVLHCRPPADWAKWVNSALWTSAISVTVETSDTIEITDVISTSVPFTLTETWNPAHLELTDYQAEPPGTGDVITGAGTLTWTVSSAEVVTLTKLFHVSPCTWTETLLVEELFGMPSRPVTVTKLLPELWIDSEYDPEVYAGQPATFTLNYSNTGGYENDVTILNRFPITVPFASAVPAPTQVATDSTWAEWVVGDLAMNDQGSIVVTIAITEGLVPSTTVEIWDGIYNHADELERGVLVTLTVVESKWYVYLPLVVKNR